MNSIFEENYLNEISTKSGEEAEQNFEHRASCHRCGNIRKNVVKCSVCPHVFCKKCADKMISMDGNKAFVDGCPLCKDLCCCGSKKTPECNRQYHCYKKCLRSRLSPTSRNSSPRMLTSLRRYPSYQSYQSQHSTIDEYMPKDSDSEDELPVQRAPMPLVGNGNGKFSSFPSMDALNTMSLQEGTPPSHAAFQTSSPSSRVPFSLTPIDTSVGFDIQKDIYERPKSKASRSVHAETPTKKMRTAEYPFLCSGPTNGTYQREMDIQFRQACFATQPPFNSGIPSIFAPHSLTRETNPFFLQSSLPTSAVLPSIQTLLQSEHANPFLDSIPPCLQSELGNMHFPYELLQSQVQGASLNHFAPDPGMGYGFAFGGNSYVATPVPSRPSGRALRQASGEKSSVAHLPAPQLDGTAVPVTPHNGAQAFVSTPNIDRACEILCNQQTRTTRSAIDGTACGAGATTSKGARRSAVVTGEKPSAPYATRSQLSELFCTPVAQEGAAFGQPSHSQRSVESGGTSYEWTGSSIGSLHNLGVEVLTPAALPQCTPITVEPPQYPPYWQYPHHQANHQYQNNQSYHQHMNQYNSQHLVNQQNHNQHQQGQQQGQSSNLHNLQSCSQQYPSYTQYAEFHTAAAEPDRDSQYLMNSFLSDAADAVDAVDAADGLSELAQDDIFALCRDVDTIHSHLTGPGPPSAMDYSHYHSSVPLQLQAHSSGSMNQHSSGSSANVNAGAGAGTQLLSGYISTPSTEQESQKLRELTQQACADHTSSGNEANGHAHGQASVPLSASAPLTQVERGEPYEAYLYSCDGAGKVSVQAQTEHDQDMKIVGEDGVVF